MILRRLHYAATPIGAALAGLLPTSRHPGKKASRTLHELGINVGRKRRKFEADVLLSFWRSMLLLRCGFEAPVEEVDYLLRTRVHGNGIERLEKLLSRTDGLILTTPHYGAFIPLLMKLSQICHGRKKLNVIFNDPKVTPSNAKYGDLFTRLGCDGAVLYPDRRGTVAALKALKRGECVAILPDVYFDSPTTMAVPFVGRLLRVMPGTAFFATRTNSLVVPLYGVPSASMGFEIIMSEPIKPDQRKGEDDQQAQYRLMTTLVAELERQFREHPAHWNYWSSLRERSSKLPRGTLATSEALIAAVRSKLMASPTLLRRIPQFGDQFTAMCQRTEQ